MGLGSYVEYYYKQIGEEEDVELDEEGV